jgi:selenocysteine-specific elongation factor
VRLVLGTAGHIDHGKTTLIRALTGVDTDRLPEEKERGITIELGFAPLDLGDGVRLSVVDVPGHERLVRTMVAGASGIDLALVVIAADEGVMPQTREHIAICELLGIDRGVVALTKIDAAEPDVADLAEEEIAHELAPTSLAGAPIVRVSGVTGAGLDALRDALREVVGSASARTPRTGPARLAVDRCFEARGFGCVVTGTLVGSGFAVGDAVTLLPGDRRARIRGVQHHGESAERGEPGVRCALNLQGLAVADVSRGQVVAHPDTLVPSHTLDVALHWLDAASAIEDRAAVELLMGTAERRARVAPIGAGGLRPGSRGFARIHLEGKPVYALPGDRFIVRGFARTEAGGSTLGGGTVLDVAPPHRRRSDPAVRRDLERLARFDTADGLRLRIERSGLAGARADDLGRAAGLTGEALEAGLSTLAEDESAVATGAGTWVAADAMASLEARLLAALESFHAREPLLPGMPTGTLRGALPDNVGRDVTQCAIDRLARRGAIAVASDVVRAAGFAARLEAADQALVERILAEARSAGLEPPSERDWAKRLGVPVAHLRNLLAHLRREGRLVRAPGDLWFDSEAIDALRERILAHFASHDRLDTVAYKGLIGTTRRTAVPLMEFFDDEHLTARDGNARVLRRG